MREHNQDIQKNPKIIVKLAIYSIGFFSLGLQLMILFLIPLYTLSLGASPFMIGLSVSAFSILPMFFSIKSGSMVDLIGSRKIIYLGALVMAVLTFLHPLVPFVGAVVIFQLINGQAQTMTWIAAQTHIAKIRKKYDDPQIVGVFSFLVNLGTFVGPLLTGYFWERFGAWGGFLLISFWALCLFVSALLLQENDEDIYHDAELERSKNTSTHNAFRTILRLLAIPAVLMVLFGTFLRLSGSGMRSSFYLVYLEDISLSVMNITILYSLFSLVSTISPLFIKMALRLMDEKKLLFVTSFFYLIPLAMTPVFSRFWSLFVLAVISGFFLGMTLPLLISLLSKAVPAEVQGLAVGIREMSNRFAAVFIPLVFGISVEYIGLELSFYVVGALLLGSILLFAPILLALDRRYYERSERKVF